MDPRLVALALVAAHAMVLLIVAWTFRVRQANGVSITATQRFRMFFVLAAVIWILFGLDLLFPDRGFYIASASLFVLSGGLFLYAAASLVEKRFGRSFPYILLGGLVVAMVAGFLFGANVSEAVTGMVVGTITVWFFSKKDVRARNAATHHFIWLGGSFALFSLAFAIGTLFVPQWHDWINAAWMVVLAGSSNLIVVVTLLVANRTIQNVLRQKALTDPLTGLMNRRALMKAWQYIQAESQRHDHRPGLIICDLDKFKRINDVFGHDVGDGVLMAFSGVLRRICRASDRLARIGGEEFMVLVGNASEESLHILAERLRREMSTMPTRIGEVDVSCTISAGVGLFAPGESFEHAFSRVDAALYRAKHNGRDRIEHALFSSDFDPENPVYEMRQGRTK